MHRQPNRAESSLKKASAQAELAPPGGESESG